MNKVQDYDSITYDYRKYWKDRKYENLSEINFILKLIKGGYSFIDIGGGYGRLSSIYKGKFKYSILFDYSINNLLKSKKYKNIYLVSGDIYSLPFKNRSIDYGMIIRVMHHIENPNEALGEVLRVINKGLILEFANKDHFLARVKHINDKGFKTQEIYHIPHSKDSQGFKDDQVFLNFSFSLIKRIIEDNGFRIKKIYSVSNFREKYIKKFIPLKMLIFADNLMQPIFRKLLFGPSIFLYVERCSDIQKTEAMFEDIIICSKDKGKIVSGKCIICKSKFFQNGIYNLKN